MTPVDIHTMPNMFWKKKSQIMQKSNCVCVELSGNDLYEALHFALDNEVQSTASA